VATEIDWPSFSAVLFDLDGVITPTAEMHHRAWASTLGDHGFSTDDYLRHIDGRPRLDGVRTFLASRGIRLPEGHVDDAPGDGTVAAIGNRKDAEFRLLLVTEGIEPYPGTVRLLDLLEREGVPAAVVTSSRNATSVLGAAGLGDRFPVVVDGVVAAGRGLAGKPDPATFLAAAASLGVDPADVAVIEDAESGVTAGVRGGFVLVVGVDRTGNARALRAAGAHVVVRDLAETLPA
jgi:HAD superfamily hydrolase (TIGR01509 family)